MANAVPAYGIIVLVCIVVCTATSDMLYLVDYQGNIAVVNALNGQHLQSVATGVDGVYDGFLDEKWLVLNTDTTIMVADRTNLSNVRHVSIAAPPSSSRYYLDNGIAVDAAGRLVTIVDNGNETISYVARGNPAEKTLQPFPMTSVPDAPIISNTLSNGKIDVFTTCTTDVRGYDMNITNLRWKHAYSGTPVLNSDIGSVCWSAANSDHIIVTWIQYLDDSPPIKDTAGTSTAIVSDVMSRPRVPLRPGRRLVHGNFSRTAPSRLAAYTKHEEQLGTQGSVSIEVVLVEELELTTGQTLWQYSDVVEQAFFTGEQVVLRSSAHEIWLNYRVNATLARWVRLNEQGVELGVLNLDMTGLLEYTMVHALADGSALFAYSDAPLMLTYRLLEVDGHVRWSMPVKHKHDDVYVMTSSQGLLYFSKQTCTSKACKQDVEYFAVNTTTGEVVWQHANYPGLERDDTASLAAVCGHARPTEVGAAVLSLIGC
eukprot:TRINITY_DN7824_c0_g1_i1.p1 TRINITY_DN7824_c0_g1~~TRINITY_DN7824_c0_g1_i1.p1  ORF type:complete len:485 (+),score=90.01 TRINITY_DN7824_c0_g1_i1:52-1506(+)